SWGRRNDWSRLGSIRPRPRRCTAKWRCESERTREERSRQPAADDAEHGPAEHELECPDPEAQGGDDRPDQEQQRQRIGKRPRQPSERPRWPMTAGDMPRIEAFIQAICLTRSSTGRIASMMTNDGRNAAAAATTAPARPASL